MSEQVVQAGLSFQRLFIGLGIDLVAIAVLAYFVYFRRHHRRDLLMAFVCFNVALFAVVTVLAMGSASAGLALGLGLLGALSIIRLRSEELGFTEIAYFFSALALAIVNGLAIGNHLYAAALSLVVVATMFVMDHLEPHRKVERLSLVLDEVHSSEAALRADVERRLGAKVLDVTVSEVDYVRDITRLEARFTPRPATAETAVLEPVREAARS